MQPPGNGDLRLWYLPSLSWNGSTFVQDLSGSGRHGTGTAVTFSTSPSGEAVPVFNGTTSTVAVGGTDPVGTGDITVAAWFKPASTGETSQGHIFSNTQFGIYINSTSNRLRVTSDGYVTQLNFANAFALNTWRSVVVTRASDGTANMYINGVALTPGSSGTPVSGNTPQVGNGLGTARTWDGNIGYIGLRAGIATAAEAAAWHEATRASYGV